MLTGLRSACVKETRLLLRDTHGLALLFALPLVFIVVMSLALQDVFDGHGGKGLSVVILDVDQSEASRDLLKRLSIHPAFDIAHETLATEPLQPALLHRLETGHAKFIVVLPRGYGEAILDSDEAPSAIRVAVSPQADKRTEMIFTATLREALGRQKVDTILRALAEQEEGVSRDIARSLDSEVLSTPVDISYGYVAGGGEAAPSSVQQNVPAWLVFSIFFVAIPFSNTFISERRLGVQRRLKTTRLGVLSQFAGKLLPYFAINQLQVVLMLLAGVFIVPLLGGEGLRLGGSPLGHVVLSISVSFAALSLALLISVVARTTEQATLATGIGNILLAAVGGIMVPRFVMPETLRHVAEASPMAWGLDGFLELLLHNGDLADIADEAARLCALGAAVSGLAWIVHRRAKDGGS